jgi:pilus assembly protein CpaB
MNRKALLIAGVSAALGLLLLLMYQERFKSEASGGRPVPVLFAVQDIALGEPLTEAKLGVRNIPEAYLEERHIRRADLRRVIGVRVSAGVRANQAVLWTDLATNSDARRDLSSLVRTGMRAVTIRADATSNFGGLIRPGDRVDVLATMARGTVEGDRVTLPLLQNVLVLAAGRDTGGEAEAARQGTTGTQNSSNRSGDSVNQVTLSTTIDEAALLVFAQDRGRLSLVLRNPEDIAVVEGLPETGMGDLIQSRGRAHAQTPRPQAPAAPARQIEAIRGGN